MARKSSYAILIFQIIKKEKKIVSLFGNQKKKKLIMFLTSVQNNLKKNIYDLD